MVVVVVRTVTWQSVRPVRERTPWNSLDAGRQALVLRDYPWSRGSMASVSSASALAVPLGETQGFLGA